MYVLVLSLKIDLSNLQTNFSMFVLRWPHPCFDIEYRMTGTTLNFSWNLVSMFYF